MSNRSYWVEFYGVDLKEQVHDRWSSLYDNIYNPVDEKDYLETSEYLDTVLSKQVPQGLEIIEYGCFVSGRIGYALIVSESFRDTLLGIPLHGRPSFIDLERKYFDLIQETLDRMSFLCDTVQRHEKECYG